MSEDGKEILEVEALDEETALDDAEAYLLSLRDAVADGDVGVEEGERLLAEVCASAFPDSFADDTGAVSLLGSVSIERTDAADRAPTEEEDGERGLLDAIRDAIWVVRIASSLTRRAADYSLRSGVRTGARMARAAGTSRTLDEFIVESQEIAFEEMERMGVDVDEISNGRRRKPEEPTRDERIAELRDRGERLLELSADVEYDESVHPAFPHILDELAPDEARILRFLATDGPQPAVNVRDVGWFPVSSELVASGLSMVGTESGCRHEERTQAYLNNLERLGLVWFSDEPIEEGGRYQLVEAQPEVKEAIDGSTRPKVLRRSIHLTPFGVEFCRTCLPIESVADDAASVYHIPDRRDGMRTADEVRRGDEGFGREDTNGSPDSIRNPHTDDPWERDEG